MLIKKGWIGLVVGYLIALVTSPLLPESISLVIPLLGLGAGRILDKIATRKKLNLPLEVVPENAPPALSQAEEKKAAPPVDPEFAPVLEYLEVLEDMIISEGQKNSLDDEIVSKSLALFTRVERVLPLLQELHNGEINHTIRRLVLKDLNGFMTPFLRLSGENKTKNRRMLLTGLKDIDTKISSIVESIEHKDLLELQTKADLIHSRYNESERF